MSQNYKTIYIGFSTSPAFYSKIISKFIGSRFTHVYLKYVSEKSGIEFYYEAQWKNHVNLIGPKLFHDENIIVEELPVLVTDEEFYKLLKQSVDLCGRPFGFWEILGHAAVKTCALFGKKIKNPLGKGRSNYVCSELVASLLIDCLDCKFEKSDLDLIDPKDVYDSVIQHQNCATQVKRRKNHKVG